MTDAESVQRFAAELWAVIDRTPEGTEEYQWVCGKGEDRLFYARQLAFQKGWDLEDLLGNAHACCDCEIVFNLAEESSGTEDWDEENLVWKN